MDITNNELIISLLQSTLDSVTDGVLVVDLMGKIILFNRQFERMWNIPPDVMESKNDELALDCILSQLEDPEGFLKRVKEIYGHPQEESYETINFLDGRVFLRYTRPQKMGDEIVGRVWRFSDVSENHRADRARLLQEEKYRNIFENAPVGIIHSTLDGKIIDVNPALARIFGYESPEETISLVNQTSVAESMYVSPQARADFAVKAVMSPGKWFMGEAEYFRKDRSIMHGRIAFRIIPEANGIIEGFVEDITERKETQAALERSETKYRLMFSESPIGMMYVDKDGNILEINQKMLDILGSPGPEATKAINMLTFPPLIKSGLSKHYHDCLKSGKLIDAETQYTTKWGKQTFLRSVIKPHLNENGEIIGSFTVIEDIALRKRAEDALRESETRYRTLFQSLKDLINMHSEMSLNESQTVGLRTLPDVSKNLEMNYIENALRMTKGKVQPAARLLGISRFMLARQMAKMKISGADYK